MLRILCAVLAFVCLWPSLAWAEERDVRFVAVGYGGRRLASADGLEWRDDRRWSDIAADDDNVLFNVTFGAGRFVAVGGGAKTGRIVTSTDGRAWTELPALRGRVATVVFARDRFIAAHDGELLWSRDGAIFTPGEKLDWRGSIHARRSACGDTEAGFRTVVIGDIDLWGEKRRVSWRAVTGDGTRWEAKSLDAPPAADVAYGSGHFVVVGAAGLIESSHDGETWTRRAVADTAASFNRVVWTGSRFVVSGGKHAWSSADGLEWRAEAFSIPGALVFAREGRLALSVSWGGVLHASTDWKTWRELPLPPGPSLQAIAVGETQSPAR